VITYYAKEIGRHLTDKKNKIPQIYEDIIIANAKKMG
jgi:hypothetical protein